MDSQLTPHVITPVILALLFAFVFWRRARRTFGRQPIRRKAMLARVAIYALVAVLVGVPALQNMRMMEGLLSGILLGALLGLIGLRLTQFIADPVKGDCYVPNPWIGGLLMVLLVARLAWRYFVAMPQIQAATAANAATAHAPIGQSPLTLLMFGLLIGYYCCYFLCLLVHHRRWQAQQPVGGPVAPGQ
jgi:Co/Zn/Cd efflux system component